MYISFRKIFFVFFCVVCASLPIHVHGQSGAALTANAKAWALKAVLESLTFSHDNYAGRMALNKKYFTEKGCKNFAAALDNYEIKERVFAGRNMLAAELWERRMNVSSPLDHISVDEEHFKDGVHSWRLDIPVKLIFEKGDFKVPYNFLAAVDVKQLENSGQSFIISNWYTKLETIGMEPNDYDERNYKKLRPECGDVAKKSD